MSPKRRLSQHPQGSANKLRLDSLNKILKIDSTRLRRHRKDALVKGASRVVLSELLRNNSHLQSRAPDFRLFLRDKDNLEVFREFLESQYCQENLDFYLACERYKQLKTDQAGVELVKFMATQIYNDFLSPNARQPVNIDHACIKDVEMLIKKEPERDLFNAAQEQVFNLMASDCFPRFCKTWQLDSDLAKRIVQQADHNTSHVTQESTLNSPLKKTRITSNSNRNLSVRFVDESKDSLSTKSSASSLRHVDITSKGSCPSECPYFSLGRLPCQRHKSHKYGSDQMRKQDDLMEHMDLRRIHKLPDSLRPKRTPPPPPLPPKTYQNTLQLSQGTSASDQNYPYVGKVFNV